MLRFILIKTGNSLITLFLAVVLVFFGVRALPGDPARNMVGAEGTPEALEALRELYGLNEPLHIQLFSYLAQLAQGNLGRSTNSGIPVAEIIGRAAPVTIQLALFTIIVAAIFGILLGIVAAVRQGRPAEWAVNAAALFGLSIPNFWLGLMLILLFAVTWPILPASGFTFFHEDPGDALRRMIMPALVLGSAFAAIIMRQTRSAMLESLTSDYVRTAKAKGISPRAVIFGHTLRNSLIAVVTVVGLQLGGLISGAVITEQVFLIPGLGKLTIDAVTMRDYPLIQGVIIVVAASYILINLLTDIVYSIIDPRIRTRGGAA